MSITSDAKGTYMTFLGHVILFFASGFFVYLMIAVGDHYFSGLLLIALPILGVYLLDWWAVSTFIVGSILGGFIFRESIESARNRSED